MTRAGSAALHLALIEAGMGPGGTCTRARSSQGGCSMNFLDLALVMLAA